MHREEIDAALEEDRKHIPKGATDSSQMLLRTMYWTTRRLHVAHDPTRPRADSLQAAIDAIRQTDPTFQPEYDRAYFGEEP